MYYIKEKLSDALFNYSISDFVCPNGINRFDYRGFKASLDTNIVQILKIWAHLASLKKTKTILQSIYHRLINL